MGTKPTRALAARWARSLAALRNARSASTGDRRLRRSAGKLLDAAGLSPYQLLDRAFVPRDRKRVRWMRNIQRVPFAQRRSGGQYTYAERVHAIGVFQTLIATHLHAREDNAILDVGCGTGLIASASEPFLGSSGQYTGLDVNLDEVEFCRSFFPDSRFRFLHVEAHHRVSAPHQRRARTAWSLEDDTFDLVVAFGVWSNINEDDAFFYLQEVQRVLAPGCRAVISCFLLDDVYRRSLAERSSRPGRYHTTAQDRWIFDQPAYGSDAWFHPRWVHTPEMAMGVTPDGLARLLAHAGLALMEHHHGNWKETPGIAFHDVLVLEKPYKEPARRRAAGASGKR